MPFTPEELEAMRLADEEIDREFEERYVADQVDKEISAWLDELAYLESLDHKAAARFKARKKWSAAYYAEHKEEIAAKQAAYRAEHKEEIAAKKAAYYAEHKEEIAAKKAAYYAEHKEEIAAKKAAYYAEHKEEIAAKKAAYYAEHKEEIAAKKAAYYAEHKEEIAGPNITPICASICVIIKRVSAEKRKLLHGMSKPQWNLYKPGDPFQILKEEPIWMSTLTFAVKFACLRLPCCVR